MLAPTLLLGAALGGLIRYLLHTWLGPYKGTLTANITASLILGTQTTPHPTTRTKPPVMGTEKERSVTHTLMGDAPKKAYKVIIFCFRPAATYSPTHSRVQYHRRR